MFKVKTENELLQLLKIVSQEAVKKSRTILEGKDQAQERYSQQVTASENLYGVKLTEQEEEEAELKPEEEKPEEEAEKSEEEVPKDLDPESFGVSFDSVVKDINTLRSGRSTKDKEIKDELLGYYDKLDEDERKILHLFLRELSKILQGALDADDAQDPSEPPFNAEITFGGDEGEAKPSQSQEKPAQQVKSGEGEDTAPPIKVNEIQDLNEIRIKVRRLMKRY